MVRDVDAKIAIQRRSKISKMMKLCKNLQQYSNRLTAPSTSCAQYKHLHY
jgi:hypothetical protein